MSRRRLLRMFLIPGLAIVPIVFLYMATHSLEMFRIGIFFAGFTTVAQLTFWGNYLPRVYPVHLRGTGEGFAANVGGRMLGTSAALVTTHLAALMPGNSPSVPLDARRHRGGHWSLRSGARPHISAARNRPPNCPD